MAKKKMGMGAIALILLLVIGVGAVAYFSVGQDIVGKDGVSLPLGTCDSTTTPQLTISSYDEDAVGTAITEATNLYRLKGATAWKTFTAGTAFDVEALETYEFVMGISTSDFTDNAYGQSFEYKIPCKESISIEREVANDEVETSLTATFYNEDGDASAETFTAGTTKDVSVKLQSGVDEDFGNPFIGGNINVMCMDLNSTAFDKPEKVSIAGGSELSSVEVPQRHSSVSGKNTYCYEMPVIGDDKVELVLKLNADDSVAPAFDDTVYFYAGNYFVNADTGSVEVGVENEEGVAVGTDSYDSVALDLTA